MRGVSQIGGGDNQIFCEVSQIMVGDTKAMDGVIYFVGGVTEITSRDMIRIGIKPECL